MEYDHRFDGMETLIEILRKAKILGLEVTMYENIGNGEMGISKGYPDRPDIIQTNKLGGVDLIWL